MATKTKSFNFASDGCIRAHVGSGTSSSYTNNSFTLTLAVDKNDTIGLNIGLVQNFGSADVAIKKITTKYKAYGEKTSSIYTKGSVRTGYWKNDTFLSNNFAQCRDGQR